MSKPAPMDSSVELPVEVVVVPSAVVVVVVVAPVEPLLTRAFTTFEAPEAPDVDEPGVARFCRFVGSEETSFDSALLVEPPAELAVEPPCAATPAGLVVSGGTPNGVTFPVTTAELAA